MQVAQPLLQQRKDVWNIRKRKKEVPLLKRLQKNLIIKKKRAGQWIDIIFICCWPFWIHLTWPLMIYNKYFKNSSPLMVPAWSARGGWQGCVGVGCVRRGGRGGGRDRKSCKWWKVDTSLSAFTVMTNQIIIYFAYNIYFFMLRCKIDQIQICMAMSYFDIDTELSEGSSALNTELSDCSVSTTELSDRSCIWYWVAFGRKFQF